MYLKAKFIFKTFQNGIPNKMGNIFLFLEIEILHLK